MIYYLLLLCSPLFSCCQNVAQKQYNLKSKAPDPILFSAVSCLIALGTFVLTSRLQLTFDARLWPYSLAFALCYATALACTIYAVRCGPIALTTLIISLALIFPAAYGVMLGETVTPLTALGFALLVGSLILVNLTFGAGQGQKLSGRWLKWVLIAFVGNGGCMIASNMQKRHLGDGYAHEFMIIALAVSFAILMGVSIVKNHGFSAEFKRCVPYAAVNGAANALLNLIVLTLIGHIPNTILYPTNAALAMLFTFALAWFLYGERFTKTQYVGYAMGVVSVILLNL
ncbi:MAG: hypothetical protein IJ048_11910 [Clostridia bacterium]|nr:hypothetical protein [Clostridia bacterium]